MKKLKEEIANEIVELKNIIDVDRVSNNHIINVHDAIDWDKEGEIIEVIISTESRGRNIVFIPKKVVAKMLVLAGESYGYKIGQALGKMLSLIK